MPWTRARTRPQAPLRTRHRPRRPSRRSPPHGLGECLVLTAWLFVLVSGAVAAVWLLAWALSRAVP